MPADKPGENHRHFIERLSRAVQKSAEKGKRSRFESITKNSREKIEAALKEQPIFHKAERGAEKSISIVRRVGKLLPPEFFINPTAWIEAQPNIPRPGESGYLPSGETIGELWKRPYDISKVKLMELKNVPHEIRVVSKRLDAKGEVELQRARKALRAGIATPKVLGEARHQGNHYAFFEYVEGMNLNGLGPFFNAAQHLGEGYMYLKRSEYAFSEKCLMAIEKFAHLVPAERDNIRHLCDIFWRKNHGLHKEMVAHCVAEETCHRMLVIDSEAKIDADMADKLENEYREDAQQIEVSNTLDLFEQLVGLRKAGRIPEIQSMFEREGKMYKQTVARLRSNDKKLGDDIVKIIFGKTPEEVQDDFAGQCEKAEIRHADLNYRNIIVKWDTLRNRPKKDKKGNCRFYLVDWEEKESEKE